MYIYIYIYMYTVNNQADKEVNVVNVIAVCTVNNTGTAYQKEPCALSSCAPHLCEVGGILLKQYCSKSRIR